MADITKSAREHNERVKQAERARKAAKGHDAKALHIYTKGLPDDVPELMAMYRGHFRTTKLGILEIGRIMMKVHELVGRGNFKATLEQYDIPKANAYRAMAIVRKGLTADLKAISRKTASDADIFGGPDAEAEELGAKLDAGEATVDDLARMSSADVLKLRKKIEGLEGKLAAEQDKSRGLERERDELKLGSIDRQRIDDKLSDWHCELTKTINWIVGLKNLDADVLYDIFSALKWTMHRCDVATLHLIEHSPALKIYGDLSDRMNTVLYRLDGMETRNFNVPEPTPETIEIMRTAGYLDAEVDGPASGEACAED